MARSRYLARDALRGVRRHLGLGVTTAVAIAVSLALVGVALLARFAVDRATSRWSGGVEVVVFMDAAAPRDDVEAVGRRLQAEPIVAGLRYVDQQDSFAEFERMFRNAPEVVEAATPDLIPTSFRVVPVENTPSTALEALVEEYRRLPGVYDVVAGLDAVRTVERTAGIAQAVLAGLALAVGAAALALTLATVRSTLTARRREVSLMHSMGTPGWYVCLPFALEGVVFGAVGGMLAGVVVMVASRLLQRLRVSDARLFSAFEVSGGQTAFVVALLVVTGSAVCGLAAWLVAARRLGREIA